MCVAPVAHPNAVCFILLLSQCTSSYTPTHHICTDPIFKNLPGYDTVLLSHMIAFGSCLAGTLLIIVLYREGVR